MSLPWPLSPAEPLVPAQYDAWWTIVVLALLVLTVAAVVSQIRLSRVLSRRVLVVWLIITVLFPPLGAIVWFAAGRPTARRLAGEAGQPVEPQD